MVNLSRVNDYAGSVLNQYCFLFFSFFFVKKSNSVMVKNMSMITYLQQYYNRNNEHNVTKNAINK